MPENPHPGTKRCNPPDWFKKSDLGIFIHWGLYSVPAYAPAWTDDFDKIVREKPMEYLFENQPYSEWYQNSIRIEGSPAHRHHKTVYGGAPYSDFAPSFKKSSRNADPEAWADLFARAGAHYVVLVTKHHDGFTMFDSRVAHPKLGSYGLDFDFAGDLAGAVREKGLKFGVYNSSLLDWSFTDKPIRSAGDLLLSNDKSRDYADYCRKHWLELIERYRPEILWGDIGYPDDKRLTDLIQHYYKEVPDGLINDRWGMMPNSLRNAFGRWLVNRGAKRVLLGKAKSPKPTLYDYRTTEYTPEFDGDDWFEMCRGIDKSFGYNRESRPEDFISADEVKVLIASVASQKGRLLLNVGPDENGCIPQPHAAVLRGLWDRTGL